MAGVCLAQLLFIGCAGSPAVAPAPAPPVAANPSGPVPSAPADSRASTDLPMTDAPAAVDVAALTAKRPPEDVARDTDRRPYEVLSFFGIGPGQRVAELLTGRGYYAEILAGVVAETGHVYAQNTPFVLNRFAAAPLAERLSNPALTNVTRVDSELEDPQLPGGLDAIVMVLFYHDTYWQNVDRARMNAAIFGALRPGGVFGIVDHHAQAGSGDRDVESLHRVDAELVKREIEAVGFVFEAESDLLRHPEDARTTNVFDQAIRGKTDRFVYRFRKPK